MKFFKFFTSISIAIGLVFIFGADSNLFAQGQSGNKSKGRSTVSKGSQRTDNTQRGRSTGRTENGINQNRTRRNMDRIPSDKEIRRFGGLARKLDTTPDTLRAEHRAASVTNPDLNFGQFVASNVIADNLSKTHPDITTSAILAGLEDGQSIGQTLRDLGLSSSEAKDAKKQAKRQIKESKREEKKKNSVIEY